VYTIETVSVLL